MMKTNTPISLGVIGGIMALAGVALGGGGAWLAALGGSWFYLAAGLGLLLAGILLFRGQVSALWVYAVLVAATLGWAVWEVGLDWWPLAARGDIMFVFGLLLLTPWITRRLSRNGTAVSAFRGAGVPLTAMLGVALAVACASWFTDPQRVEGGKSEAPAPAGEAAVAAPGVPPGEWAAYGRTQAGQRYSPLAGCGKTVGC